MANRHLGLYRYPGQPAASSPSDMKGVIRYALVSRSKFYRTNGRRECERRRAQQAKRQVSHNPVDETLPLETPALTNHLQENIPAESSM